MNHVRRTVLATATVSALLTALAGCGGGGPSASDGKISGGKVTLGVVTDLSGVYASLTGQGSVDAVKMAVDDYKKKYGDKAVAGDIEVLSADHQNKPETASTKARELYERKGADALFDVPTSSAALAVQTVAGQSKKMYFNVGAATPELVGKTCNPYTYAWAYDAYMLAHGTGATVTAEGGKNWYLLYPDYAFGEAMSAGFEASVKAAGGTVVKKDPTPFPNDNFSTFLLKASTLKPKPQILGVLQAGGDLVNVVKQYDQFKLKRKGIGLAIGLISDTDIEAIGADKLAGAQFTSAWWWNMDDKAKAWSVKFKERTGKIPSFDHAGNYSAATQYLEAIQRAGTDDPAAVRKELDGMTFDDVFAHSATVRAADHRVTHDAYLARVKAPGTDPADTTELVRKIPAAEAFGPADPACKLS
ncbi:ABC transporter substrate-binding protein [Streptomyces sp. NPDC001982]|uniref:ABC transporter substrate-binding protein n=1 Tax=Streptomyces sp. NPDC001982 TaxID=3154405 RepID=UPI003324FA4D